MGKVIALDVGSKRTGIAITDELQIIASPLDTIAAHELLPFLSDLVAKSTIDCFVFGDPRQMDGSKSESWPVVEDVMARCKRRFPSIPHILQDERLTSKMALDAQITGGMKKNKRRDKGKLDVIAACLILQSYLENKKWQ
ncbi:MAG: putative Holliday junction resolvase [Luteibaculaceae bacterium]|jgi:putative Holliday junction resolvase